MEPNKEYFKAAYGKWCDAFDFHIYQTAADVCRDVTAVHEADFTSKLGELSYRVRISE